MGKKPLNKNQVKSLRKLVKDKPQRLNVSFSFGMTQCDSIILPFLVGECIFTFLVMRMLQKICGKKEIQGIGNL